MGALWGLPYQPSDFDTPILAPKLEVCIRDLCVDAELSVSPLERARGLSYRTYLPEKAGMLFIFETEAPYTFWMRNTFIPLDIIWLNADKRIVDIQQGIPLDETYRIPRANAKYVLEINGGLSREYGLLVGDQAGF